MAKKEGGNAVSRAAAPPVGVAKGRPATKTVRLGDDLTDKLQLMADERGMSFSAVVRTAAEMYLQREEFAVALGDVETNIASTLNAARRDTAKVAEDVQLVVAILDQFVRFSMIAAPDVIDKEGAVALGNRRYSGFVGELHKAFHTRRKKAVLTQTLEGMGSEEAYG
ncbi:putative DNA-binding protein [Massilia sp. MP_M2]|uniref:ribbon-helix-helix domain-containing protein n=1 Tax=Massilia sp. MP_M2 TaxID=3071713 RepID=UPI00319EAEFA